jgi:glutaconyl-CoA/methylmalonyl-CoA decarboxylase subunit gamma
MKKRLRITVKGQTYDVVAEILEDDQPAATATPTAAPVAAEASEAPAAPAVSASASASKPEKKATVAPGDVPSPIAGRVVSIEKPVGSIVAEGEVIVMLEAMKMNTEVSAPCAGKVVAVKVNPGDSVDENQVLMTLA